MIVSGVQVHFFAWGTWILSGGRGAGLHKTGIRGIQDTRQIDDGKTNDIEINDKKGGSKHLT